MPSAGAGLDALDGFRARVGGRGAREAQGSILRVTTVPRGLWGTARFFEFCGVAGQKQEDSVKVQLFKFV